LLDLNQSTLAARVE